jgi:sulfate/thiosulfate transport system substrate-binding protein
VNKQTTKQLFELDKSVWTIASFQKLTPHASPVLVIERRLAQRRADAFAIFVGPVFLAWLPRVSIGNHMKKLTHIALAATLALSGVAASAQTLLNASYDVAREFYKDYNAAFIANYKKTNGKDIKIDQAHGGSSAQARAVNDGLDADVVTMNTTTDVDFLAGTGVVAKDWQKRFPNNASPTTSTMLFLTRNGNPKGIKDWDDLVKPGIQVIVVNPKTGGNGRMAYLAAWGYAKKKGASDAQAAEFVGKLYKNVPVLAKGGRDATTIFLQRNIGDVLVTFESEVVSVDNEFGAGKVDAIHPSISIVAENPVAVVERTVAKKGTADLAKAYLNYLYSDEAQEIAAKHALRPRNPAILKKYASTFKPIQLFTVQELFGSLAEAQKVHFNDGGQFDKLYTVK